MWGHIKPARSLSFLVPFWSGLVITVGMMLYATFQYLTAPDVPFLSLLLQHLWHAILLGGMIQLFFWLVFRKILVRPIEQICLHLYHLGTGWQEPLKVQSKILEVQQIIEGINAMVRRGQLHSPTHGADSDHPNAPEETVPEDSANPQQDSPTSRPTAYRQPTWMPVFAFLALIAVVILLIQVSGRLDKLGLADGKTKSQLERQFAELSTKISTAENKLLLLASNSTKQDNNSKPTEPLAKDLPATAEHIELQDILSRLETQIAALDSRFTALEEKAIGAKALKELRRDLSNLLEERAAELEQQQSQLQRDIESQFQRFAELETNINDLEQGAPTGTWRTIESFLKHTNRQLLTMRGPRDRTGQQQIGVTRYRSKQNFPGALKTTILESGGRLGSEAEMSRLKNWADGQSAYFRLRKDLEQSAPFGWTFSTEAGGSDLQATRVTSPDGSSSFIIGIYDYSKAGSRWYISAIRFGEAP